MMTFTQMNKTLGGIRGMLRMAVVLSSLLPVLALAGEEGASPQPQAAAPDDELVGTLPIYFDPGTGMPTPELPEIDPDADPDAGGGGSLLPPPVPIVNGAPKLYLYGPHNLLVLHRSAIDSKATGRFEADLANPGHSYLILEGTRRMQLPADLFTDFGFETGLLISGDEVDPVAATVGYLGQYSTPFQLPNKSKKDFPVAALHEYGFLAHGVGLFTFSSLHGRTHMMVKNSGAEHVQITLLER